MAANVSRRFFVTGLGAGLVTAPAIVRAASLMQVRAIVLPVPVDIYGLSPAMQALADLAAYRAEWRKHFMVTMRFVEPRHPSAVEYVYRRAEGVHRLAKLLAA